jgi:hypothetical protein
MRSRERIVEGLVQIRRIVSVRQFEIIWKGGDYGPSQEYGKEKVR